MLDSKPWEQSDLANSKTPYRPGLTSSNQENVVLAGLTHLNREAPPTPQGPLPRMLFAVVSGDSFCLAQTSPPVPGFPEATVSSLQDKCLLVPVTSQPHMLSRAHLSALLPGVEGSMGSLKMWALKYTFQFLSPSHAWMGHFADTSSSRQLIDSKKLS